MVLSLDSLNDDNIQDILSFFGKEELYFLKNNIFRANYQNLLQIFRDINKYKLVCKRFNEFFDKNFIENLKKNLNYLYLRNYDTSLCSHHSVSGIYGFAIQKSILHMMRDYKDIKNFSCTYSSYSVSKDNLVIFENTGRKPLESDDAELVFNLYSIHDMTYKIVKRGGYIVHADSRDKILKKSELPDFLPKEAEFFQSLDNETWIFVI